MNNEIIETLTRIETKLDAVIKAMHDYDDNIYSGYDEPNEALLKAAGLYNEELNKEYGESSFEAFQDTKNDILSWDVDGAERRMDIIGQNGNEGLHYTDVDDNEFDDYGKRVVKDSNNTQDKHTVGDKKRNKRKYYKPKQPK